MSGKNLILKLNIKLILTNEITGFLKFNISKAIRVTKWIFFTCMYISIKDTNDDVILGGHAQTCPKRLLKP